jgi:hypothetical protein
MKFSITPNTWFSLNKKGGTNYAPFFIDMVRPAGIKPAHMASEGLI